MAGSSAIRLGSDELKKQTGLPTDVVVVAGAAGSVSAKLRRLTTDLDALAVAFGLIDFATQTTLLAETVQIGDVDSAVVAAGAIGSVTAKLRRLTADIGALIIQIGDTSSAAVAAGAVGDISAKLRRLTTDMGALIIDVGLPDAAAVAAGAVGDVSAKLRRLTTDIGALILQIGANADAAVAAGAAGSVSAKLRRLSTDLDAFKTNFDASAAMDTFGNGAPGAHGGEVVGTTYLDVTDGDLYVSTGAAWVLKLEDIWV